MSHASNTAHVSSPLNQTTYRKAVNIIRSNIKTALRKRVHIYPFNIPSEQLESAYALLDKEEERKSMRVTYSNDCNFIVRYMPSLAHEAAIFSWHSAVTNPLILLTPPPHPLLPPGVSPMGATTFQFGSKQKQADGSFGPHRNLNPSHRPSIVLEVGSSESMTQLKIDARLWLEHMPEVQLVVLLSIDPPIAAHPNLPRITIQLWRGFPPCAAGARQREACMVWQANWTHGATPLYILLVDIFRGPAPPAYGNNDHVHLDTAGWRQAIIDGYI